MIEITADSAPRPPAVTAPLPDAASLAAVVERVRALAPRVHCVTNSVATNFTAHVLLAAGAVPSMTIDPPSA